ncbi:MAG: hypothetical protein Tsb002_09270 [Wenzhouxiangellaceae bacterium]
MFSVLLRLSALLMLVALGQQTMAEDDPLLAMLDESPRHHEWVWIDADGRQIQAFIAYPESEQQRPAVLLIHENRGLTDWVRVYADELAAEGYVAIAPDLLSSFDSEHRNTGDFASGDAARAAIYELPPGQVMDDLARVQDYVSGLPASNSEVFVAGFCWGGSQTFRYATRPQTDIEAALVFYGSPPSDTADLATINAPVYGFYGADDQRINATIEATRDAMLAAGKIYEPMIYPEVGHAFMRRATMPDADTPFRNAKEAAKKRMLAILDNPEKPRSP